MKTKVLIIVSIAAGLVLLNICSAWYANTEAQDYYKNHCRRLEDRAVGDDPAEKSIIYSCPSKG
jgi:hypothetical protein